MICTIMSNRLKPKEANWRGPTASNDCCDVYEGNYLGNHLFHLIFHDKADVHIISTFEPEDLMGFSGARRNKEKPELVTIYNQHKGTVDALNHALKSLNFPHYTRKWTHELFNQLVDIALF